MQTITKKTSQKKTSYLKNRKIEWIVLHYTAGTNSKKGAAEATANYFKNSKADASADFIVDDETIVQYNPDIKNRYCWAVGGSKYTTKSTSLAAKYYGKCTNLNSINIEMCSNKSDKKSLLATDTNWYFTDATFNNAVDLVKYLMETYNIDIDHVIMHHMVTGKCCPNPWCVIEDRLVIYNNFLARVSPDQVKATVTEDTFKVRVTVSALRIRKGPSLNTPQVGLITDKGVYTIVEKQGNFGKLKSGQGWICLDFTTKLV
jgi:N-acetylmuramoyl-L-alanine amidase CwlA